jgi:hypothetical protein
MEGVAPGFARQGVSESQHPAVSKMKQRPEAAFDGTPCVPAVPIPTHPATQLIRWRHNQSADWFLHEAYSAKLHGIHRWYISCNIFEAGPHHRAAA